LQCLDEDTVLTFVDGKMDDPARDRVEAHLADCTSCADLIAASAGGNSEALASRPLEEALQEAGGLSRGDTVGRYVILNLVGRGDMGEVYAAYDPQLDRRVALKLLHDSDPSGASPRIARHRLLREAKAIARLSHPNVVVVHDAGAIADSIRGERVFLAMEYIEGQTLSLSRSTAITCRASRTASGGNDRPRRCSGASVLDTIGSPPGCTRIGGRWPSGPVTSWRPRASTSRRWP
jgi:hypothetical protein